jgi:hypothetical protein
MRKLFSLLAVSGLALLASSGFAHAGILEDAMNAVNSLVAGIRCKRRLSEGFHRLFLCLRSSGRCLCGS